MKTTLCITILLLTFSCNIGKRQVTYYEMAAEPTALLTQDGLLIQTKNSIENSALLIYSIKAKIDQEKKKISLMGFQAVGKEFKTEFLIDLNREVLEQIINYKLVWVNPDGKETGITIKTSL